MMDAESRIIKLEQDYLDIRRRRLPNLDSNLGQIALFLAAGARTSQDGIAIVSVTGAVESACNSAAIPGAVASFVGHPSGISAGSLTADGSGNISGLIAVPAGDTSVNWSVSSPWPGLNSSSGSASTSSGSVALGTVTLALATGYVCFATSGVPVATSYSPTVAVPTYANTSLAWNGAGGWTGHGLINTSATGGGCHSCAAATGVYLGFLLDAASGDLTIQWSSAGTPLCPVHYTTTFGADVPIAPSTVGSTTFGATYALPTVGANSSPLWGCAGGTATVS